MIMFSDSQLPFGVKEHMNEDKYGKVLGKGSYGMASMQGGLIERPSYILVCFL